MGERDPHMSLFGSARRCGTVGRGRLAAFRIHFPMITKTPILIVLFAANISSNALAEATLEQRLASLEARVKQLEQSAIAKPSPQVEQPAATKPRQPLRDLVINITPQGTFLIEHKPLDLAGLSAKLKEIGALQTKPRVIIRADPNNGYRHVDEVLEVCKAEGLTEVAFASAPVK